YCYIAHQLDYQIHRMGPLALAVGQLQLVTEMTRESVNLVFSVLHLGGWDFHCCVQPFSGRRRYGQIKTNLCKTFQQASGARTVLAMTQMFGTESYGLDNLFAEERHRIMTLLTQDTLTRLNQLYTQVYRDNYGVVMAFQRDQLSVPQELQVAADVALSHQAMACLQGLEQQLSDPVNSNLQQLTSCCSELGAIAAQARHLGCQLNLTTVQKPLDRLIAQLLWQLLHDFNPATVAAYGQKLARLIELVQELHLPLAWDRAQELYFQCLHKHIVPQCNQSTACSLLEPPAETLTRLNLPQLRQLLQLGQKLRVDVGEWLAQLS
ncbi:MAG TPA: DUF3536 domain-containing protein, partial [Candidatus Caenarcaniphilales bacterium]